jgi:hypothetical protein
MHSLPTRGQRTRTNARTRRGKKKTVGALSKEAAEKLAAPAPAAAGTLPPAPRMLLKNRVKNGAKLFLATKNLF